MSTIEGSYDDVANPIGILYGFVVLFGSFLNWAMMRVICVIAENVIQIRRNSDEALNKEPTKTKE